MENVKGVLYVTYADMVSIIRKNLWRIPHDIDVIIGVPRSGLFAATIISEYLGINIATEPFTIVPLGFLQTLGLYDILGVI